MKRKRIPEAFHPGEYLNDELEERGWSVDEFAEKIRRLNILRHHLFYLKYCHRIVSLEDILKEIIAERESISPEMAEYIGEALETGTEVWLNLQAAYDRQEVLRSARKKK